MAKSLIRNVDGIGIWVADTTTESFGIREKLAFVISIILAIICDIIALNNGSTLGMLFPILDFMIVAAIMILGHIIGIFFRDVPAYSIYAGIENGITVFKTTPDGDPINETDQLAICKAAQEIESRCHEIAAKRRELDRIAAGCK